MGLPSTTMTIGEALAGELDRLARACRILRMEGHGDITMGHLSLRDPEGRGFWMKRAGIGLGEVREAADFVLLDFAGTRLDGPGEPHIEWPLHGEIFRARPDVRVVGHSHPFYATTFSATRETLRPVAHDGAMVGAEVPCFTGTSALIDTPALGREVAASLGAAPAVLMRNHGVTFCGDSVVRATLVGIFVEKACRAQLTVAASHLPWSWPEGEEYAIKTAQLANPKLAAAFWGYFNRELDRIEGRRPAAAPVGFAAA